MSEGLFFRNVPYVIQKKEENCLLQSPSKHLIEAFYWNLISLWPSELNLSFQDCKWGKGCQLTILNSTDEKVIYWILGLNWDLHWLPLQFLCMHHAEAWLDLFLNEKMKLALRTVAEPLRAVAIPSNLNTRKNYWML